MIIKLDIDGRGLPRKEFENRLRSILRIYKRAIAYVEEFTTRRGRHVYVQIPVTLAAEEAILIQALLGSDQRREIFNLERIKEGVPLDEANVLFRRKMKGSVVESEETPLREYFVRTDPEESQRAEESLNRVKRRES